MLIKHLIQIPHLKELIHIFRRRLIVLLPNYKRNLAKRWFIKHKLTAEHTLCFLFQTQDKAESKQTLTCIKTIYL